MATKVIMPKQGLQMTEGTILKWLYSEGDKVEAGKPLFEMETDKLTIEIEAPATGTLLKIVKGEGETVPITELIGVIGEEGEDISDIIGETKESESKEEAKEAVDKDNKADYDVLIIGAGPGGYECAIRCGQLKLKTAVIEKSDMGGTCLNWGCIPTKSLLHSAEVYESAKNTSEYGIKVKEVSYDYSKIAAKKDKVVKKLRGGVEYLVKNSGAEIIRGTGKIKDKNTVVVDGKEIKAKNIIIATGSRPSKPPIEGIDGERVIDSNDVLSFKNAPESMVIIGGGVIGVEFASIFNALGKKVTIVEMMKNILPETDEETAQILRKNLEKKGIKIFTDSKVTKIKSNNEKGICIFEKDGKEQKAEGDYVVVAIGRSPNTEDIGLENIGIKTEKGFIKTNKYMETEVKGVYAIGDVTGKALLAHVASAQGLKAAENIAGNKDVMEYNIIPGCIYTSPEVASVGLTEKKAKEKGYKLKIGKFPVSANGKAMITGETDGQVKIITDEVTGEILGCHIIGPRATDMIAELCVSMKLESTIEEIADTIHPHPTISEMILEAAHDVEGMSINKP